MALTETRAVADASAELPRTAGLGVLGSGDHKVVGRLFIATSLAFLVASLVGNELLAVDRLHSDGKAHLFLTNEKLFLQLFTNHAFVGVLLGLVPLFLGIAMLVVPLQVGARTVAFPRAATGAFAAYLFGGGFLVASIAVNGGPAGGRSKGVELWFLALIVVVLALLVATVCVVTTAIALRAPGMTLDRVPLFTWGIVVSGVIWLLTLPVLLGSLVLLYVDFRHGRVLVGDAHAVQGSGSIYYRTIWLVRQPQIYAFAAPALGLAGDVLPVTAKARYDAKLLQYQGALVNIGMFAVLGFGAFMVTGAVGNSYTAARHSPLYIGMSFLAILPVFALFALAGDLFRRGAKVSKPKPSAAFVASVASLLLLLTAALAGAAQSVPRTGVQGTLYDDGHFKLVLLAGAVAAIGGLYHWAAKILPGKVFDLGGAGAASLVLAGGVAYGAADMFSGGLGNATQSVDTGIKVWNWIGAAGGLVAVGGILLAVLNLAAGLRPLKPGTSNPDDPWEGHTLEWLTTSPPAFENFDDVPFVTSEAPLLDRREAAGGKATS
jgi:cytochrome c oxidase subunit 1